MARKDGFLKRLKVSAPGDKTLFVNDFVTRSDCSIGFAGPSIGDMIHLSIKDGSRLVVQSSSYIAST